MTAWIVGRDTRWRCAVLGDAAVDWVQAYDLSGTGNLAWSHDSLGGSPWQSDAMMARYREDSPITYARSVRTPTLILTGLADQVVSVCRIVGVLPRAAREPRARPARRHPDRPPHPARPVPL